MPIQRKSLPENAVVQLSDGQRLIHDTPDVSCVRGEEASTPQFTQSQPQSRSKILISPRDERDPNDHQPPIIVDDRYRKGDNLGSEPSAQYRNETFPGPEAVVMLPSKSDIPMSNFGDIPFTTDPEHENEFNAESNRQDVFPTLTKKDSKVTTALQDASIFLGGLINHPTESNKHFTVLRHSHGLVYYKGPATSIAITIFADAPLPSDRRYWLQMKGWTGKTGMKTKALLRTNASWINVTPARQVQVPDLAPLDERAWQRDIKRFQSKASKQFKPHLVRETAVLRVPYEAVDGYFRVIITTAENRSPLCTGPVFRVASTSMSASSIKGASLGTLPIELGVKILQFTASQTAANAISPVAGTVKQQIVGMLPSAVQNYGQTAYSLSGAEKEVNNLNDDYNAVISQRTQQPKLTDEQYIPMTRPGVVGDINGPTTPFPIHFESTIVQGTGQGLRDIGVPTANLRNVPDEKLLNLSGVYFGWSFIQAQDPTQAKIHSRWRHAIITISYSHNTKPSDIAAKRVVRVYLIHDYSGQTFFNSRISVMIMGHLRPAIQFTTDKEAVLSEIVLDIEITRNSLARDAWGPDLALQRIETARSDRSFTDRYVNTRTAIQRRVDSIPIHKLGIRNENSGVYDRGLYGNGGIYVVRDGS